MRSLGARLMDHFDLHRLFGIDSAIDLFGSASSRAHYTSALRYPVLKAGKNYSGDNRLLKLPLMREMVDEHLASELASMGNAWIVPFGPTALSAVNYLAANNVIDEGRVLGGILHPGGQQWNRYNVQLGLVSASEAAAVPGGLDVLERGERLKAKVRAAIELPEDYGHRELTRVSRQDRVGQGA